MFAELCSFVLCFLCICFICAIHACTIILVCVCVIYPTQHLPLPSCPLLLYFSTFHVSIDPFTERREVYSDIFLLFIHHSSLPLIFPSRLCSTSPVFRIFFECGPLPFGNSFRFIHLFWVVLRIIFLSVCIYFA